MLIADRNLAPLLFVVACGGMSSRMGIDKSLIIYHELPQRYHLYDLIKNAGLKVCLSVNNNQAESIPREYCFIIDRPEYIEQGPISGLLSVHFEYPNHAIFYIGCDYPALELTDFIALEKNRNLSYDAIALSHEPYSLPEPLLCIYEPELLIRILNNFNLNKYSLLESLTSANILLTKLRSSISSIDTPEERQQFNQHRDLNS